MKNVNYNEKYLRFQIFILNFKFKLYKESKKNNSIFFIES